MSVPVFVFTLFSFFCLRSCCLAPLFHTRLVPWFVFFWHIPFHLDNQLVEHKVSLDTKYFQMMSVPPEKGYITELEV